MVIIFIFEVSYDAQLCQIYLVYVKNGRIHFSWWIFSCFFHFFLFSVILVHLQPHIIRMWPPFLLVQYPLNMASFNILLDPRDKDAIWRGVFNLLPRPCINCFCCGYKLGLLLPVMVLILLHRVNDLFHLNIGQVISHNSSKKLTMDWTSLQQCSLTMLFFTSMAQCLLNCWRLSPRWPHHGQKWHTKPPPPPIVSRISSKFSM